MIRLGVLGWPVAHSRSPAMQNAALRAAGLDGWHYQLLPVPPELFEETVRGLPAAGFRGANVTIPHKQAALALAAEASARARAIGAANTLLFGEGGRIWADNTDAPALVNALQERIELRGAGALVLGAGGSARAAAWALKDAGADVCIWNRTPQRAGELAAALGARTVALPSGAASADVLINCTPVGLDDGDELEALSLSAEQIGHHRLVVDLVYSAGRTPLLRAAIAAGVPTIDGLELLVGQGAIAFELFTGRAAPVEAMRDALGSILGLVSTGSGQKNGYDRSDCSACRATGKVISGKGGTPHEVTCPWCGGDGRFHPGRDAQTGEQIQTAAAD